MHCSQFLFKVFVFMQCFTVRYECGNLWCQPSSRLSAFDLVSPVSDLVFFDREWVAHLTGCEPYFRLVLINSHCGFQDLPQLPGVQ